MARGAALVAAAALLVAACTASSGGRPPQPSPSTRAFTIQPGATVQVPSGWHSRPFPGEPGTVVFPLVYLSDRAFGRPCIGSAAEGCAAGVAWLPESWAVPADGFVLLWTETQFPSGTTEAMIPGERTSIDGRPAKVREDAASSGCTTETDAFVPDTEPADWGRRLDLSACFGPQASLELHREVDTMLQSLRITASS